MEALSPKKKVERAIAMAKWTRDVISKEIRAECNTIDEAHLELEIAKRVYCGDEGILQLIEQRLG